MYNTNNSYQWHCTICLNTVHLTRLNDQCTFNRNLFTIKNLVKLFIQILIWIIHINNIIADYYFIK